MLHALTGLVALEPEQAQLLDAICASPIVSAAEVEAAAAVAAAPLPAPLNPKRARGQRTPALKCPRKKYDPKQGGLL